MSAFPLTLPQDAVLLPHIVHNLLLQHDIFYHSSSRESDQQREIISQLVNTFISDPNKLFLLSRNTDIPARVKGAAALLYILHPITFGHIDIMQDQLIATYKETSEDWLLQSITTTLAIITTEKNASARLIVGHILEYNRSNFEARETISALLSIWRERSQGPIQNAGVQEHWLSQS